MMRDLDEIAEERRHEDRALQLMRELRAMPGPGRPCGDCGAPAHEPHRFGCKYIKRLIDSGRLRHEPGPLPDVRYFRPAKDWP